MSNFKAHVFICTNSSEGEESCAAKGAKDLRGNLKKRFKEDPEIDQKSIRINSSGCLGLCSQGIACVIYPEGEWITRVNVQDEENLYKLIKNKL